MACHGVADETMSQTTFSASHVAFGATRGRSRPHHVNRKRIPKVDTKSHNFLADRQGGTVFSCFVSAFALNRGLGIWRLFSWASKSAVRYQAAIASI